MTDQQHQQPSVGRIVHVVGHNGRCDAAIVTEVSSPIVVSVTRMPPRTTPYPQSGVHFDADQKTSDSWHYPEGFDDWWLAPRSGSVVNDSAKEKA